MTARFRRAIAVRCLISNESQVKALFAATASAFGSVDILVNNAAYRPKADFMEMSVETWDLMHAINTRGTFLCMREAIALMRASDKGGSIVNVSTIDSIHPTIFNNTHYDSSKAGVNALTMTSAVEFAPTRFASMPFCPAAPTPKARADALSSISRWRGSGS